MCGASRVRGGNHNTVRRRCALHLPSTTSRTIGFRHSAAGGDLGQIPLTPLGAMPRFEATPTILTARSLPTG